MKAGVIMSPDVLQSSLTSLIVSYKFFTSLSHVLCDTIVGIFIFYFVRYCVVLCLCHITNMTLYLDPFLTNYSHVHHTLSSFFTIVITAITFTIVIIITATFRSYCYNYFCMRVLFV